MLWLILWMFGIGWLVGSVRALISGNYLAGALGIITALAYFAIQAVLWDKHERKRATRQAKSSP